MANHGEVTSYDMLAERLEHRAQNAERLGIAMAALVLDTVRERPVFSLNPEQSFYAASVNKLIIAQTVQDLHGDELHARVDLQHAPLTEGPGTYDDSRRPPHATVGELVHSMLSLSDNSAAIIVTRWLGGANVVNEHARELDMPATQLEIVGTHDEHGTSLPPNEWRFHFGTTSPADAVKLLGSHHLARPDVIVEGLRANTSTKGARRYKNAAPRLVLANKRGAFNDAEDGSVRHDVGWLHDPATGRTLTFAYFTHVPARRLQASLTGIADQMLQLNGADMFEAMGAGRIYRARGLGRAALDVTLGRVQ